mgnify:FL=1
MGDYRLLWVPAASGVLVCARVRVCVCVCLCVCLCVCVCGGIFHWGCGAADSTIFAAGFHDEDHGSSLAIPSIRE